jgi:hypothetical protein
MILSLLLTLKRRSGYLKETSRLTRNPEWLIELKLARGILDWVSRRGNEGLA